MKHTRGRVGRALLAIVFISFAAWASPACKSNEVNQTSNTNNNFTTIVGPKGAVIEGPDSTKLRIPPGALDKDVAITIREATPGEYPALQDNALPPQPWTPVGKVWAFEPHGLKFYLEATMWLPAPAGEYFVAKAQPGGRWETYNGVVSADGMVEYTTKGFSFYAVKTIDGPSGDAQAPDTRPIDPCETCRLDCDKTCEKNPACVDSCLMDCEPLCGPTSDSGKDEDTGSTSMDTGGDTTMTCATDCPPATGASHGKPCGPCPTPYACPSSSGSCMCVGGVLECSTSSDASADSDATDTSVADTAPPGPECGDSVITAPETCDDGNNVPGDGCSGICRVESGYKCPDAGSACEPI